MRDPVQEGKDLYNAGRLHGAWPANELLARVEALEACRNSMPAKRKRMWFLLLGGFLATVVFAILHSSLQNSGTVSNIIGMFCFLAMCAGMFTAIVSIVLLILLGLRKYDADASAVLGPLIRCLGPDLAKGALLKVSASLKPPTDSALLVRTGDKYSTAKYPNCVDSFFKREILDLECRLSDGTRLLAGMAEHTIEKVHKKKNPRGKWKTKKKTRRKIGIRVRLLLDESRCRLTDALRLPNGTSVRVRRHPRGALIFLSLTKILTEKQSLDARPLLAVLAGAYSAVTMVQQNEPNPPGGIQ